MQNTFQTHTLKCYYFFLVVLIVFHSLFELSSSFSISIDRSIWHETDNFIFTTVVLTAAGGPGEGQGRVTRL